MFDIKAQINDNLKEVDEFREEIASGKNEGFLILSFENSRMQARQYLGDIPIVEWIGLLEIIKKGLIDLSLQNQSKT